MASTTTSIARRLYTIFVDHSPETASSAADQREPTRSVSTELPAYARSLGDPLYPTAALPLSKYVLQMPVIAPNAMSYEWYQKLSDAINHMESDDDEEASIDHESARIGRSIAALMWRYRASAPKLFSHGGDALVFTWDAENERKLLTMGRRHAWLQHFERASGQPQRQAKFDLTNGNEMSALMRELGGNEISATSVF